jgi:cytochrome c553
VPPLAGSEFVATGPETIARILLRGIDGPIMVEGERFDGHMPNFASVLPDGEIRQIANYVAKSFSANGAQLSVERVAAMRKASEGQTSFRGGQEIAEVVTGLPKQPLVSADASEANTLDPEVLTLVFRGRGMAWACASCHGDLAQGTENVPRLAGLPAHYIAGQLGDFKSGDRHDASMQLVAKALTEDEMKKLGAYFSALRVPSTARPALGADLARGEQLALHGDWLIGVPACFTCHGPSGFGVAPNFPALAAQQAPYVATQLAGWKSGRRPNSPLGLMQQISKALSTEDRRAVADYLASLPPVPAGPDATANLETGNGTGTAKP